MMPRTNLVIFDCDGVLLDREILSCECAVEALQFVSVHIPC